jgi:hypothetical protein
MATGGESELADLAPNPDRWELHCKVLTNEPIQAGNAEKLLV